MLVLYYTLNWLKTKLMLLILIWFHCSRKNLQCFFFYSQNYEIDIHSSCIQNTQKSKDPPEMPIPAGKTTLITETEYQNLMPSSYHFVLQLFFFVDIKHKTFFFFIYPRAFFNVKRLVLFMLCDAKCYSFFCSYWRFCTSDTCLFY